MTYELWDLRHRNCLGAFASRQEAFEAVRAIIQEQPDLVETLELDGEDEAGRQVLKASGHELAELSSYRQYA